MSLQQIAFKNLVERNKDREKREGAPAPNSAIQVNKWSKHLAVVAAWVNVSINH